jgi:hypothetical protein
MWSLHDEGFFHACYANIINNFFKNKGNLTGKNGLLHNFSIIFSDWKEEKGAKSSLSRANIGISVIVATP